MRRTSRYSGTTRRTIDTPSDGVLAGAVDQLRRAAATIDAAAGEQDLPSGRQLELIDASYAVHRAISAVTRG